MVDIYRENRASQRLWVNRVGPCFLPNFVRAIWKMARIELYSKLFLDHSIRGTTT